VPVTVGSAEIIFSNLKLLMNYLRSPMTQEGLNYLMTLYIDKKLLDVIDIVDVRFGPTPKALGRAGRKRTKYVGEELKPIWVMTHRSDR
jgi:hypothetical protein